MPTAEQAGRVGPVRIGGKAVYGYCVADGGRWRVRVRLGLPGGEDRPALFRAAREHPPFARPGFEPAGPG